MGIAIRTNEHVSIDYFYNLLDVKKRRYASRIVYFIATFFCAFLFVSSLILTANVFRLEQLSAGLQIRMGFIYSMLPVATFISTIRYSVLVFTGDTEG
jgi:TRAP-type C4-dicarboxylate transport system permease small subunit